MTEEEKQELIRIYSVFGDKITIDEENNKIRVEHITTENGFKIASIFPIKCDDSEERLRRFSRELAES